MATSGTYAIGNVDLLVQPTAGRWIPREVLGIAGSAQPMYPAVREFEMSWELLSPAGFNQIQTFFNNASGVSTVVVNLPIYGNTPTIFQNYTGCVLQEPGFGDTYFADDGYIPNVRLLVTRIRT